MKVKTVGIDLAKDVFGVHGVDARGKAQVHRRVTRKHLLGLLAKLEPCLLGMEACGSAHHWAREIEQLGHNSVAAVELANKNARIIWALLTRGDNYRPTVPAEPGNQAA